MIMHQVISLSDLTNALLPFLLFLFSSSLSVEYQYNIHRGRSYVISHTAIFHHINTISLYHCCWLSGPIFTLECCRTVVLWGGCFVGGFKVECCKFYCGEMPSITVLQVLLWGEVWGDFN